MASKSPSRHGSEHWWKQRLTSIGLAILTPWFLFNMATIVGADYHTAKQWLESPISAPLAILFIVFLFHHIAEGIEVILDDYVHTRWIKLWVNVLQKILWLGLSVVCILAVVKIFIGG